VVVFHSPQPGACFAHRAISVTDQGVRTRGDNGCRDDGPPAGFERVVGRVEMLEDWGTPRPVQGGPRALWEARMRWGMKPVFGPLRRALAVPFRRLRRSSAVRRVVRACLARHLSTVCLQTPQGPLFKMTYRGHTVATWCPELNRFEGRKPFDLFISRPDQAEQ
jgi:hypothetical protein